MNVNKQRRTHRHGGFSLIELVIVVVIIGIISAIAIPRLSRGAAGASDSALKANLSVLRNALDLYAAEHNGDYPTVANINADPGALTAYSDANGDVVATKDTSTDTTHIYGPYLRSIPPMPVGTYKGETAFTDTPQSLDSGWVYNKDTGVVYANTALDEAGDNGKAYADY